MTEFQRRVDTAHDMHLLGREIGRALKAGDMVMLSGELGAGKTTLTRGIGEELGVEGTVSSPTFVIARTHRRGRGGAPLVHVDAYRLSDPRELDDLDIDFSGSIVVVEWGRGMVEAMVDTRLEVDIDRARGGDDDTRTVTLRGVGSRWEGTTW